MLSKYFCWILLAFSALSVPVNFSTEELTLMENVKQTLNNNFL